MHRVFWILIFTIIHCFQAPAQQKVMFSNNYAPFNFCDEDGELVGFNIDLFKAITTLYETEVEIGSNDWQSINKALKNGEIEAIGGTHYPGSIDNDYIYTRSFINTSHCFFFNTNYRKRLSLEQLRSMKKPIVVLYKNDILIHYILSLNPSTEFKYVKHYNELLNELEKEETTCAIAQRIGGSYYIAKTGKDYIATSNHRILERNMGFRVSKSNPELAQTLNHGLEVILSNGEYDRIYNKWLKAYNEDLSFWNKYSGYILPFILFISISSLLLIIANRILQIKVRNKTKDLQHQLHLNSKIVKELEVQKTKAEESEKMKSAFLANMSHEIRTPMNGILGFTELLEMQEHSKEEQQQFINVIKQSGLRMLDTINNIIDVSKLETGAEKVRISQVNIEDILTELHTFFAPEAQNKGLDLYIVGKNTVTEYVFFSDAYKLNSILTNLIKNALKFTKEGLIKIEYTLHNDYIQFKVCDTGIGIDKTKQEAIFNQFVQADNSHSSDFEGSGLGLSITQGYVKLLNGVIRLESEPGKGSTFFVNIPNAKPQPHES